MKLQIRITAWRATFQLKDNPLGDGLTFINNFYHFKDEEAPILEFKEAELSRKHYKATLIRPRQPNQSLIVMYYGRSNNEEQFGLDSKDFYSFNFCSHLKFETIEETELKDSILGEMTLGETNI